MDGAAFYPHLARAGAHARERLGQQPPFLRGEHAGFTGVGLGLSSRGGGIGAFQAVQACTAVMSAPCTEVSRKANRTAAAPAADPSTPKATGPAGFSGSPTTTTGHSEWAASPVARDPIRAPWKGWGPL
ncbi:hypothetical protein GCM10010310_31680 [Streptomyces violaceolatus]|uniref:Uncharacterized protein n=1 Tax=Streptomyces violaceolatus TaxID=67378 RepID=A0ABN3SQW7_9ACTN